MNKKGFTLIEVIGVVTVLALILIVAVPSLTRTLKRNEQNKYNAYIDNVKVAAENYLVSKLQNGETFDEFTYFYLGDLIDAGYIKNTITNPENDKNLSRDTRIKITKELDGTYGYSIKETYNNSSDYNRNNLVIHYDAFQYSINNTFKSLTDEIDYDYSGRAVWSSTGVSYDKTIPNTNIPMQSLKETYSTNSITVSINMSSLDEFGTEGSDYTYPLNLRNSDTGSVISFGFRKNVGLFYQYVTSSEQYNTVFSPHNTNQISLEKDKKYTITFVQENLQTRKMYVNGREMQSFTNLNTPTIQYNEIKISPLLYNLKINNVLIYNRALSDEEVQKIYELDKERFGE